MTQRVPDDVVEWGGSTWRNQLERGLAWLGNVDGQRVLDVGTRNGRMATWLALSGARVVGVDISDDAMDEARRYASVHGVSERTTFATYSGVPADLPGGFDVVFAKSVAVLMEIEEAVAGFADALAPEGRLLLVENARGPWPVHVARMARRRSLQPHRATYFTPRTIETIRGRFDVELECWTTLPPTVVVGAYVRSTVRLTSETDRP